MRTRLLVSVAALAATLLLPAAASAVMTAPVVSAPTPTNEPVLSWDGVDDEIGYRVLRADGDCSGSPIFLQVGVDLPADIPPDPASFTDTTLTVDGAYCYVVQAFDGVGTADSLPITVDFDRTDPTVTLSGVASSAKVHGSLSLSAVSLDTGGSGVAAVRFEYRADPGDPFTQIGATDTTSPYGPVPFDTTQVANGATYEIQAVATDNAGNTLAHTASNVMIDNILPNAALSGVTSSTNVRGSLSLSATAGDTGGSGLTSVAFEYRQGSSGPFLPIGSVLTTAPFGPVSFDTTSVADGSNYQIHALATDGAGNQFADAATGLRIDNTQPTVTLSGVASSAKVRGSLSLSAVSADTGGSGVASVRFEYRAGSTGGFTPIGSPDTTAPYGPVPFDTTSVSDGAAYEFQAVATDNAGNTLAHGATSVMIDNTQPTVTLSGVASSAKVRGSLSLSAVSADTGGSGVASVRFEYRAGSTGGFTPIGSPDTTAPYGPVPFDTTSVSDGAAYEFQAVATDNAGNTLAHGATSVMIDNTPPPVTAPSGLSPVAATPQISFSFVTDALSGVDHYDVYRGPSLVHTIVETGALSYSWADTGAAATNPPSSYSYTVVTVDKTGNASAASGAVAILLDASGTSAPTGLVALANPTNQHPQFSWDAPTGYTPHHYKIYRNSVYLIDVPSSQTTFTDDAAGEGISSYQVRAAADVSEALPLGVVSASLAITYDTRAPTAPGGVTAAASLDGSVAISWAPASDAGSGIARYVVRRSLSSSAPVSAVDGDATCQGLFTACGDATTLNGKLYSYSVFAVDAVGNTSLAGSSAAVTARDQLAPGAPKGLVATPGDASVDLRWSPAGADDDVAGYVLVAKQGTAAPASEADGTRVCTAIVAGSTACSASGLTNGATYTFGLFALDEALNRSQAAVASAVPNGKVTDVKAPAAVTGLRAKISGTKVTLTWKNPSDRDFDHVVITASERKPSARAAAKRVYSGKGTKATTRVAAGEVRWFTVVAYDAVGNASRAATVRVKLAPPSLFGPEPRAKVHGKVQLSWPVAKGAKYYNVQVFAGKKRILVSWPAGRALQLPKAKLKRGTTYTWYVWPGLGAKAKAHYGKLIGKNTFTFAG